MYVAPVKHLWVVARATEAAVWRPPTDRVERSDGFLPESSLFAGLAFGLEAGDALRIAQGWPSITPKAGKWITPNEEENDDEA